MTLNKAQGKTFSRGLLLLTRDVFAHGQLYVGLTRFGAASDVAVLVSPERRIDGRAVVLNVVSSSLAQPVYQAGLVILQYCNYCNKYCNTF